MPRYRLLIEYDGTPFCGWQRQADRLSVQQALEEAIERFSGESIVTQAAGRTDAGVHALGQVAHFDLEREWDPFRISEALNYHLKPLPVAVLSADGGRREFRGALQRDRPALRVPHPQPPRAAPRSRITASGTSRFRSMPMPCMPPRSSPSASTISRPSAPPSARPSRRSGPSTVSTVSRHADSIVVTASARSFLHHQVRSMVGSLKLVGEGRWSPADFRAALDAADRSRCGPMAPPDGLYLVRVDY